MSRRKYYFDHTREPSENIKSTKQDCLCILSRKQFYEILVENVSKVRKNLMLANSPETVQKSLDNVELLIICYTRSPYDEAVTERLQEVLNTIHKVHMHDLKRGTLAHILALLIKDAREIIKEEEKKEQCIEVLQSLFMEMAEHAPEISALFDLDKILK